MDIFATNAQISSVWTLMPTFVELNRAISSDSSQLIGLSLGYGVKRIFMSSYKGMGPKMAVLANQNEAQGTFPQTTFSLC